MKKYQIIESYGNHMHAGSKATNDCAEILSGLSFIPIEIIREERDNVSVLFKITRQLNLLKQWRNLEKVIDSDDVLVLQHPFRKKNLGRFSNLKKLKQKNVKIISLVHDVEFIRGIFDDSFYKQELDEMITFADKIIVHNQKMKEWFIEYGVDENRLVILEVFDYLNEKSLDSSIEYSKTVTIAGNLSRDKSPYLYQLDKIKNVQFKLMGINYESEKDVGNIDYLGAFSPDDVPNHLVEGFGLVWDGASLETCDGPTGNYLRYNNPHKLSLYLSSGMPVIVWKESAEAQFIKENNLGLVVDSLHELSEVLEQLGESEYKVMVENVHIVMKQMKEGFYLTKAINEAL